MLECGRARTQKLSSYFIIFSRAKIGHTFFLTERRRSESGFWRCFFPYGGYTVCRRITGRGYFKKYPCLKWGQIREIRGMGKVGSSGLRQRIVWEMRTREKRLRSQVLENTCWKSMTVFAWVFFRTEREGANPVDSRHSMGILILVRRGVLDLRRVWTMEKGTILRLTGWELRRLFHRL